MVFSSVATLIPPALFKEQVEKMLPTDTAVYWQQDSSRKWNYVTSSKEGALVAMASGSAISGVKIYNRALSPEEIYFIYQRERGMYGR